MSKAKFTGIAAAALISSRAFAEGGGISDTGLMAIGSALAIGLATFGAASAQGRTAAAALEGIARNPQSKDTVFVPMILGLVFIEFQALLGFIIAYLLFSK